MPAPTICFGPAGYTDAPSHDHPLDSAVPADATALICCNSSVARDTSGFADVTDTGGHTWTKAAYIGEESSVPAGFPDADALCCVEIWATYTAAGMADTVTVTSETLVGQSPTVTIVWLPGEWERNEANGNAVFTATPATPNITTDGPRVIFGLHGFKNQGEAPIWTPGSGWTELTDFGGPSNTESGTNQALQYRDESSGGTFSSTGTSASTDTSTALIAAFEEVAGDPPPGDWPPADAPAGPVLTFNSSPRRLN